MEAETANTKAARASDLLTKAADLASFKQQQAVEARKKLAEEAAAYERARAEAEREFEAIVGSDKSADADADIASASNSSDPVKASACLSFSTVWLTKV